MGFVIRVEQTAVAYTYESWEEMLFHGEGLSTGVFDRVGFTLFHLGIWIVLFSRLYLVSSFSRLPSSFLCGQ